jgi:riboflavin synthase
MFTGIIEAIGKVESFQQSKNDWKLAVDIGKLDLSDVVIGDSIAVNGCCLTVIELSQRSFVADVSQETMQCTTFGKLCVGSKVNLEKAMRADSRFGGHIVSGHVDGVGKIVNMASDGNSIKITLSAPEEIAKYIAGKGSICVDGTSLTVNEVISNQFMINIIPHTQVETIFCDYTSGRSVNLEADLIARHLERLMTGRAGKGLGDQNIDAEFLSLHGFNT